MTGLTDRVRELLRHHAPPAPLSERDAVSRLRPYGQGVQAAVIDPPSNTNAPRLAADGALALDEREFGRVGNSTP